MRPSTAFAAGYASGVAVMAAALLAAYGYFVEGSPKRNVKPAAVPEPVRVTQYAPAERGEYKPELISPHRFDGEGVG